MAENSKIEWCHDLWHKKAAAKRLGINLETYVQKLAAGLKWCTSCKGWHERSAFVGDRSRRDGLSSYCAASRSTGHPKGWHERPAINPITGRPGPIPDSPRSGDKRQARQRINVEVQFGRRAHPNTLPCKDCGHEHLSGGRRHEYDHHLGYEATHHYDVEAVCTICHHRRSLKRGELVQVRDSRGRYYFKKAEASG